MCVRWVGGERGGGGGGLEGNGGSGMDGGGEMVTWSSSWVIE
jgi:hypothetical protein